MRALIILCLACLVPVSPARAWEEPARGTATRAALMDAIRPHAEWNLGALVQFVVHELRRAGDVAFAMLHAQRPGGGAIVAGQTPMVRRGQAEGWMNVSEIQVLYRKSGETWVAVHYAFGATDVWFAWGPLCRDYRAVISDYCTGVAE